MKEVKLSAKNGKERGEREGERLWNEMGQQGRPAISEAIEQELIEYERKLWRPGQPYPVHPGQHQ